MNAMTDKKRVKIIRADWAAVPPVGTAHIDPVPTFHPPSLRNPLRVAVDDPMEDLNTYLDVFKRTSLDTWRYRMELLRHAQPASPVAAVKTLVEQNMGWLLNLWCEGKRK